ncbi:hypothetical protein BVER_01753 [Candidatus Burkholderia verschuerenii]|uniref:Uncharacterized protein n=1 Tax=Candidatus Burkholderia verschuerenii TaxID=242163 RepID=A0A0L0MJU4_9BURK|nr:hypothetical protein [Candidatus Burkholderia verschuerenii]KND62294.1 hypothetical protein BVER_01753 [Candidatus Burkholderia verschuerenii]
MNFPDNEKTVGFVVTEASTAADLQEMHRSISHMCADRVVVLSQQSFDVREAPLWPTLEDLFNGLTRHFVVESVASTELAELQRLSRAKNISILMPRPPLASGDATMPNAAIGAIKFALETEEGLEFLRAWLHGDFSAIRRDWPDAPENVFVGADPTHSN